MTFNSLIFLIFFPLVLIVTFLLPAKVQRYWLLAASWFFYAFARPVYLFLLITSTVITYISAMIMQKLSIAEISEKKKNKVKRIVLCMCIVINILVLFYFKYSNFTLDIANEILRITGQKTLIDHIDIVLPIGISFYTFQALGYAIDVYRGNIYAEKNFIQYALFVSFFPQLVAGPIERSKNLLKQLSFQNRLKFNYEKARDGFMLMIWGYFLKIIIADRIAVFVDEIYGDPSWGNGSYVIIATVLFAIQIYCDFGGYSAIAIGAARILGVELMENFNAPYLSESISDFWKRWHISLTSWFRDYLYIPLGGNRKGRVQKYINIMIVFMVSGLWHGASLNYVIWGGINGFYQVIGDLLKPVKKKFCSLFRIHPEAMANKFIRMIITFILVDFSWIFFRARDLRTAVYIIKQIGRNINPWVIFDGSIYQKSLDEKDFGVLVIGMVILLIADCCKRKGIAVRQEIITQDWWFRWLFVSASIVMILILGMWGTDVSAEGFIYFAF